MCFSPQNLSPDPADPANRPTNPTSGRNFHHESGPTGPIEPSERARVPLHERFFARLPGPVHAASHPENLGDEHPDAGHTVQISLTAELGTGVDIPAYGRLINWFAAMPGPFRASASLHTPKADYVRRVQDRLIPDDGLAVLIDTAAGHLIAHHVEVCRLPLIAQMHRDPTGGNLDVHVNAAALRLAQRWAFTRTPDTNGVPAPPTSHSVLRIREAIQAIAGRLMKAAPGTDLPILLHAAITVMHDAIESKAGQPTAALSEAIRTAHRQSGHVTITRTDDAPEPRRAKGGRL